jgi:UDP-GlcNAc:undecaprenyl-phosphate GlcNAc-1-phosphate transferase
VLSVIGIATFIAVFLCCEFADWLGCRLGVVDRPDGTRKLHRRPTPLVGGIALALPLVILLATGTLASDAFSGLFVALLIATAGFWSLGFADDRWNLRPAHRLLASAALFAAVTMIEPDLQLRRLDFEGPLGLIELGVWGLPLTLLCTAGLLNAVNMADGKNGIVLGMATCWLYGLAHYAPGELVPYLYFMLVCLAVLFIYNRLGRLFLGDSGSYVIGALVGLLAIYLHNRPGRGLPEAVAVLWFLVPVLDCVRLSIWRISTGRSPFSADRHHLHHYLARRLPWRQGLPLYLALATGPGFVSIVWPAASLGLVCLVPLLYAGVLWWASGEPAVSRARSPAAAMVVAADREAAPP